VTELGRGHARRDLGLEHVVDDRRADRGQQREAQDPLEVAMAARIAGHAGPARFARCERGPSTARARLLIEGPHHLRCERGGDEREPADPEQGEIAEVLGDHARKAATEHRPDQPARADQRIRAFGLQDGEVLGHHEPELGGGECGNDGDPHIKRMGCPAQLELEEADEADAPDSADEQGER
jgi:hypothetical protein